MLPQSPSAFIPGASFSLLFNSAKTSHGTSLVSAFPEDLRMRSLRGEYCYVRNTPVTLLTNFWLVPVMLSLPFTFRDSRNLGFALELGCSPWTLPALTSSSCHTLPNPLDHGISSPQPISVYSKVLPLVSVRLCFPVFHHVTLHSCVLSHTSDTPDLMLCSLF